jgi:hypothetical protein
MQKYPEKRFQVFLQERQNWRYKGCVSLFQVTGGIEDSAREYEKQDRFIGVFDASIEADTFFDLVTDACMQYRYAQTRRFRGGWTQRVESWLEALK